MPTIKIILALGLVAHNAILSTFKLKKSAYKFTHNKMHNIGDELGNSLMMIDSYHCSRYNTSTKRLTTEMFEDVFESITGYLK